MHIHVCNIFFLYLVIWLWQVTYTSFSIKLHTKSTNTIYWIHLNVKTFVDKMNKLCSLEIHFYTRRFWVDISNCPNIIISYITNLVCYTYFHWFLNPECQDIFGKQTGYIFHSPKTIKTWTTKHYASLNQWYNTE